MSRLARLVCLLVLALATVARAADVEVRSGFEVEAALLGEGVDFRILVDGTDDVTAPDVAAFGEDFDVRFVGGQPSRRSTVIVVNGRQQREDSVTYALLYELRPRRAGLLRVPPLRFEAAGGEVTTTVHQLRVIGPEESRYASISATCVPARAYVEQEMEIVLEVAIQRAQLPEGWYDGDPWPDGRPPQLRVPWFDTLPDFAAGDFDAYRRKLLAAVGGTGFNINGEAQSSLLGGPRAVRFALDRRSEIRNGRAFHVYTLRKSLVPLRSGRVNVPVASMSGELATVLRQARGQLEVKESEAVFVATEPFSIDVLPVPDQDRPPTYTHAVGRYEASAELTPTRAKVGDPLTLTLRVRGRGMIDRVAAPNLAAQPDLAADFQVSEADPPRTEQGVRVFTYLLRPRTADVNAVPPLEVAAFDPESESFRVARTDAIDVTIEEARAVQASEVIVAGGAGNAGSSPGDELAGGLLGNYADAETLADESFEPSGSAAVWALLVLPPLLFAGVAVLARRRDARRADPAALRARAALPRAVARVEEGRRALDSGDRGTAAARLHEALAGYVADRTNRPAAGLTAADVGKILGARPAADEIVGALRDAEAARFGGVPAQVADALDAAPGWLRTLEQEPLS